MRPWRLDERGSRFAKLNSPQSHFLPQAGLEQPLQVVVPEAHAQARARSPPRIDQHHAPHPRVLVRVEKVPPRPRRKGPISRPLSVR